jgi:cysteinyl-tRNA synthetase
LLGARVEPDEKKEDPLDFALWKKSRDDEPGWDSPWGRGRPGWHIECTVMSTKYLGKSFDIHGGGMDLIFPHHENEIAQAECAFGQRYVKYWLHNGFVNINKEKMSKSTGLFFTIRDVLKKTDPEVLRFFLLSKHYRSPLDFSEEGLKEAWRGLTKFYSSLLQIKEKLKDVCVNVPCMDNYVSSFISRFTAAMDDDFNTARAIGIVFDTLSYISSINEKEKLASCYMEFIKGIKEVSGVLGVFISEPEDFFKRTNTILANLKNVDIKEIETLIQQRTELRKMKNFKKADEIREKLKEIGIVLEDTPSGTRWRFEI